MKADTRRKLEMGTRVLNFSEAHPDPSTGYANLLAHLRERLIQADHLAERQRVGIGDVRTATQQKRKLRRLIRRAHLVHLASVAQAASEMPELAQKFALAPLATPYMVFRNSAGGMAAEAEIHKEVLVKHGLVDSVLEGLVQALNLFDQAVELGISGRAAHVGASAELEVVAADVAHTVATMVGLNRSRFAENPESMAAWESATNTFAPVKAGGRVDSRSADQAVRR